MNINKLIRAAPSLPSWLFALFSLPNNNNKSFFSRNRNNFSHEVCLCFGRMNKKRKLQNTYSDLCAALVQTRPVWGGKGEEAGSGRVFITSQILPHFQFFSIKRLLLSLPPPPSRWPCSPAAISWATGRVRDSHPSACTSPPFPSHPWLSWSQLHWVYSHEQNQLTELISPKTYMFWFVLEGAGGRGGATPSRSHV